MSQAVAALWASFVRTLVPIIVGAVLGLFASANIQVDPEFEKLLTGALTVAFTTAYYVAVRLFETYISPKLGWLLGYAKSPDSYSVDKPGEHVSNEPSISITVQGPVDTEKVATEVKARVRKHLAD